MYKERVRWVWVKCPNCRNEPQLLSRPDVKRKVCVHCGRSFNAQDHIAKKEVS